MQFEAALVKEQGVTFAVIVVKKHILDSQHQSLEAMQSFAGVFPAVPIILMAQDSRGIPSYRGRKDIVNFLTKIHISQIPWRKYTI